MKSRSIDRNEALDISAYDLDFFQLMMPFLLENWRDDALYHSKGELEDKISRSITQWEKEYLGRGPISVKTDIVRNMVIIVLKGILTPAERNLAKTQEGMLSIKKIRADLIESGKDELKQIITDLTEVNVSSFHTDVSTRSGERVMVFILHDNLEERFHM
jgi:uncharacterized protein YbcI